MQYKLSVEIKPASYHFRYVFTKYVLCDIDFHIECDDNWFYLESETSDKTIKKLLSKLDGFLEGRLTGKRRTTFRIPYIIGEGMYIHIPSKQGVTISLPFIIGTVVAPTRSSWNSI